MISANPNEILTITKNSVVTGNFTKDAYTLTVTVLNEGVGVGGTVTKTPDQPTYEYGDQVTLEAVANPGWDFAGWEGDITDTNDAVTIDMTDNTEVIARFQQQQQQLTTNVVSNPAPGGTGPGGAILRDPNKPTYGYGETVTLTASAFGGWIFDGWSGALSGNEHDRDLNDHRRHRSNRDLLARDIRTECHSDRARQCHRRSGEG